jgi:general secretion pathway protein H
VQTGKQVAKAMTLMWAVGSRSKAWGFTLLELLVVLTIIAIGSAGVSFALRDSQHSALEREADRLSALLEAARVQSRSSGVAVEWVPMASGFVFKKVSEAAQNPDASVDAKAIQAWLHPDLSARIGRAEKNKEPLRSSPHLLLGPEPMMPAAEVTLSLGNRQLKVATDGLRPFEVRAVSAVEAAP